MRLATACLLLLSTIDTNNNTPVALVNGFQFNSLNHITSTRTTNAQNVGTPQISSTPTTSSQPNTITSSNAVVLAAANQGSDDNEDDSGFGKKKGRPKPPPRRSPTKDIKKAMAANDLVRFVLYCVYIFVCVCIVDFTWFN